MSELRVSEVLRKMAESYYRPGNRDVSDMGRLVLDDKMKPGAAARYWAESAKEESDKPVRPPISTGKALGVGAATGGVGGGVFGALAGDAWADEAQRPFKPSTRSWWEGDKFVRETSQQVGKMPRRWPRVGGMAALLGLVGTGAVAAAAKSISKGRANRDEEDRSYLADLARRFQADPEAARLEAKQQKKGLKKERKERALQDKIDAAVEQQMAAFRAQQSAGDGFAA